MHTAGSVSENVTVDEAAALKGVSRPAIYKALREGRLPYTRSYGRMVIPREALTHYLPQRGGNRGGGRPRKTST